MSCSLRRPFPNLRSYWDLSCQGGSDLLEGFDIFLIAFSRISLYSFMPGTFHDFASLSVSTQITSLLLRPMSECRLNSGPCQQVKVIQESRL